MKIFNCMQKRHYLLEKRELNTKWVAKAWQKIKKQPDMTKHSFMKRRLSNNLNGSADNQIKIQRNLRLYNTSPREEFNLLKDDQTTGSEDEFTAFEKVDKDTDDSSLTESESESD